MKKFIVAFALATISLLGMTSCGECECKKECKTQCATKGADKEACAKDCKKACCAKPEHKECASDCKKECCAKTDATDVIETEVKEAIDAHVGGGHEH